MEDERVPGSQPPATLYTLIGGPFALVSNVDEATNWGRSGLSDTRAVKPTNAQNLNQGLRRARWLPCVYRIRSKNTGTLRIAALCSVSSMQCLEYVPSSKILLSAIASEFTLPLMIASGGHKC